MGGDGVRSPEREVSAITLGGSGVRTGASLDDRPRALAPVSRGYPGAQAIQLFDSWVGCLSPRDYGRFVLPHTCSILDGLRDKGVPLIRFGTGAILDRMKEAGGDVIGVDWRVPIDLAWDRVGSDVGIQGNLDPTALFAPKAELIGMVDAILDLVAGREGHVFNLGHGILPETPIEAVETVVDRVHARTSGP